MYWKSIYGVMMGLVMLDYLLCTQVIHADCFWFGAGENVLLCGMESCAGYRILKILVSLNNLFFLYVPDKEFFVFSSWAN